MAESMSQPRVGVASRILALLGVFDTTHRRLSLTEMACRAELPLSTVHRMVAELEGWGALSRQPCGGYVIGRRLWDVGLTVHLAVRDGLQALFLARLAGHASVPVVSRIGSRLPLHTTGVGKVLLAHSPADIQREVLNRLTRITPHTIAHPGTLAAQLTRVRRDGFATTVEEMTLGACSVAVPVFQDADVTAALGIVVPTLKRHRPRLVAALQLAAQGVSRSLR
jgi:DNA-binding IclR family transcriptional regulator